MLRKCAIVRMWPVLKGWRGIIDICFSETAGKRTSVGESGQVSLYQAFA